MDETPPELGPAEQAVVEHAKKLAESMQRLRKSVESGNQAMMQNYTVAVNVYLRAMRSLLRNIGVEIKQMEGKQPLKQTEIEKKEETE